jgi:hypothetical protein
MSSPETWPANKGFLAVSPSFFSQIPCCVPYLLKPLDIRLSRLVPLSPRNTAVQGLSDAPPASALAKSQRNGPSSGGRADPIGRFRATQAGANDDPMLISPFGCV